MFKPLAYDDPSAVNHIVLDPKIKASFYEGKTKIVQYLLKEIESKSQEGFYVLCIDGYVSVPFEEIRAEIDNTAGKECYFYNMKDLYKTQKEITDLTKESLPLNYDDDPVLLFGKLYAGEIRDFIDKNKLEQLKKQLGEQKKGIHIIYGIGSAVSEIRELSDGIAYIDTTPKVAAIRAREKKFVNIGDEETRSFPMLMRRNYYVDFEVVQHLRKELLQSDQIDYYILANKEDNWQLLSKEAYNLLLDTLALYPFRAKPVYLEGIWGGEYIRKIRNIPKEIASNIAWIFDFIPMEVSIEVAIDETSVDIPFYTFIQKKGLKIMGKHCYQEFDGYFPIRFNYDDTWHSNGNMSIQVHPDEKFVIENYRELGRQDEAYYVVATGHGARTYVGWKGDGREFLKLCRKSEETQEEIDYQHYINSVPSMPGRQIMIPAGTIHASGRNQVILELGSLTVGSYTYKVYDYNRKDKDGKLRPIHTKNAEKVLRFERDGAWVDKNIAIEPILLEKTKDYTEYIVGQTELMYYQTNRIEINTHGRYDGKNKGQFTVITLVDGEEIQIYSKSNPEYCYTQRYLEIVTIPATIEDYVIEAKGYQPVVVHKTFLKEGYTRYMDKDKNSK